MLTTPINAYAIPGIKEKITLPEQIIQIVAKKFNTTPEELKSRKRTAKVASARHVALFMIRKQGKMLYETGAYLNRDHATALHSCKTVQNMFDTEREFRVVIREIQREIGFANFNEL